MQPKYDIGKDIKSIKVKSDFIHYLSFRIRSSPELWYGNDETDYLIYKADTQLQRRINQFISVCISLWNEYHPDIKYSFSEILWTLLKMWEVDSKQTLKRMELR